MKVGKVKIKNKKGKKDVYQPDPYVKNNLTKEGRKFETNLKQNITDAEIAEENKKAEKLSKKDFAFHFPHLKKNNGNETVKKE